MTFLVVTLQLPRFPNLFRLFGQEEYNADSRYQLVMEGGIIHQKGPLDDSRPDEVYMGFVSAGVIRIRSELYAFLEIETIYPLELLGTTGKQATSLSTSSVQIDLQLTVKKTDLSTTILYSRRMGNLLPGVRNGKWRHLCMHSYGSNFLLMSIAQKIIFKD